MGKLIEAKLSMIPSGWSAGQSRTEQANQFQSIRSCSSSHVCLLKASDVPINNIAKPYGKHDTMVSFASHLHPCKLIIPLLGMPQGLRVQGLNL